MNINRLIKYLDQIIGPQPPMSWSEKRSLRFSVFVFLQSIVFSLFLIPVHIYFLGLRTTWLFSFVMLINVGCFYAIRNPKFRNAVNLFYITFSSLLIFLAGQIIGNQYQMHLYLFFVAALPFAMFPKKSQRTLFIATIVPMFFLFCVNQNLLQFFTAGDVIQTSFINFTTITSLAAFLLIWGALF